jgi:hypothetical protein
MGSRWGSWPVRGCLVGVLVRLRRLVGPGAVESPGCAGGILVRWAERSCLKTSSLPPMGGEAFRRWSFAGCWLRMCRGGGGEAVAVGVDQPLSAGEVV